MRRGPLRTGDLGTVVHAGPRPSELQLSSGAGEEPGPPPAGEGAQSIPPNHGDVSNDSAMAFRTGKDLSTCSVCGASPPRRGSFGVLGGCDHQSREPQS